MVKCHICQVLMRELCFNENREELCKLYEDYEQGNIQGEDAINKVLEEADFEEYQRAKNSIKEKGLLPDELFEE